jgi:hypothetical protein
LSCAPRPYELDSALYEHTTFPCLVRWPRAAVPVPVKLEPTVYSEAIQREAIAYWSPWLRATQDSAPITVVVEPERTTTAYARYRTDETCRLISVKVAMPPPARIKFHATVLGHELGHALGLAHDPHLRYSIMHPRIESAHQYPTDHDKWLLKALYD